MANMASFRNGFKIICSAALPQKNLININGNTFNVRRGYLGRKGWCTATINLDEEATGGKSKWCSNTSLRDTSNWKHAVAGTEMGETSEGQQGSKDDSQTHKSLVIDPNNSMWQLYRESKSSFGKGRHRVGESAFFSEISPPKKMSGAIEEQSVTENVQEYYKARWESEHEACETNEESVSDETLSTPVRRTEVQRSLRAASKGSASEYKKPVSQGSKPRSIAVVEDIDEPLAGKILGEHPLENLEGSYALSSPSTMTVEASSKTRPKVGERPSISLESESLTSNKEVSSTIPASSTPFKTPLLTFKYNPVSHFNKNLFRYYSICSLNFSKETRISKTNTPLLYLTYSGFNAMAMRNFVITPLELLNPRFPFMKSGNISSYRFVGKKSKDCSPPKQELPCVKPAPKPVPCKMDVYKVSWPKDEKICMSCCQPVEQRGGEQVKVKSCKKSEYRFPSFSECEKEKTEKKQKECCYRKLKCPEHEIDAASKSPFKTVQQRRNRILGRKPTEDLSCKKRFSTKAKNDCEKPSDLPCFKKIVQEKMVCNPGENFVIKWPECEKICLPCCRPVVIHKCEESVKLKSCKKQEYHHPSFSECKKDKLVERRLKECCHEEKQRCARFDLDNVKRSPFLSVQQRTDKILGREVEPCVKHN